MKPCKGCAKPIDNTNRKGSERVWCKVSCQQQWHRDRHALELVAALESGDLALRAACLAQLRGQKEAAERRAAAREARLAQWGSGDVGE